jgi:hypothetical protein
VFELPLEAIGSEGAAGGRRRAGLWCAEGRSWPGVYGERLVEGSLSAVGDGGAAVVLAVLRRRRCC